MSVTAMNTFGAAMLVPVYPHEGQCINVALGASLTLAKGTVLGEIQLSDVYSISTGTQGSGTFTITVNGATTSALARNASAATIQTAVLALSSVGTGNATVVLASGTPGTDAVYTLSLIGTLKYRANTVTCDFSLLATPGLASLTHSITGQPLGTYKAYNDSNSDGSQTAAGILQYDCATDSSGNITLGTASGGGNFQQTQKIAPMYINGAFYTSELTGLDANAVADLGRLIEGTVTTGILKII